MKKIIELDNLTKSFDGQVILKGIRNTSRAKWMRKNNYAKNHGRI